LYLMSLLSRPRVHTVSYAFSISSSTMPVCFLILYPCVMWSTIRASCATVEWRFRKPNCSFEIRLFLRACPSRRCNITRSSSLLSALRRLIGLYESGLAGGFWGFRMAITLACFHVLGKCLYVFSLLV
jgi:hypothetical protein